MVSLIDWLVEVKSDGFALQRDRKAGVYLVFIYVNLIAATSITELLKGHKLRK